MISKSILPDHEVSYWLAEPSAKAYPALAGSTDCDVAIIGGGIAGLHAAYKLKAAGLKVVVLEKNTIGSGTTGGTTGKVTTQHGLIYDEIRKRFGEQTTRQYAIVSQQAFRDIEALITKEAIKCDWHAADNFVYTTVPRNIGMFRREASVAADMGLPATFEASLNLPFEVSGAVKFAGQACFNSVKYVRALAKLVHGNGSYVFEHSNVKKIHDGDPCTVKTGKGAVTARSIVIATKVPPGPLAGRVTYAAVEYPVTSYIVAGRYAGNLQGMYISPDKNHYSLLPFDTPDGRLLLVGGESHIPGIKRPGPLHMKLSDYADKWFGVERIDYRWKAMDYIAYDSLPLIGPLYPWSKNVYVIGGFKKWGLNLSMVAANLLTEAIAGHNKAAADLFSPHRWSAPAAIPRAVVDYFK